MTADPFLAYADLGARVSELDREHATPAELGRAARATALAAVEVMAAAAQARDRAIRAMRQAGMTQQQVADALGVSKQRVSQLLGAGWRADVPARGAVTSEHKSRQEEERLARYALLEQMEDGTRGYFYRRDYRGRRDPYAHFTGRSFRRDLASRELLDWHDAYRAAHGDKSAERYRERD